MLEDKKRHLTYETFELEACKYDNFFNGQYTRQQWKEKFEVFEQEHSSHETKFVCPPQEAYELKISPSEQFLKKPGDELKMIGINIHLCQESEEQKCATENEIKKALTETVVNVYLFQPE